MKHSGIIYQYVPLQRSRVARFPRVTRMLGYGFLAIALGGMAGPLSTGARLEASYYINEVKLAIQPSHEAKVQELPKSVPVVFNPLVTEDGASIDPINTDFSVIIPKIGVNAAIAENVNPANADEYLEKLKLGVAHAATSFTPDKDGTTYLFSHSTNYDWFVRDLNAVFYLLKNLDQGDLVVIFYKGTRYTYRISDRRIVSPKDVSYLVPQTGKKQLILQTCWPPGSTTERLLLFADLVEEYSQTI